MKKLFFILMILTGSLSQAQISEWVARYNTTQNDYAGANSIVGDNLGNIYVSGYSKSASTFNQITTIKYNSSGIQQWVSNYEGFNGDNMPIVTAIDNFQNVYVTGTSVGSDLSKDIVVLKYNTNGNQQWVTRYNGDSIYNIDTPVNLIIDNIGNIYVGGSSTSRFSPSKSNYIIIKYSSSGALLWSKKYDGGTLQTDINFLKGINLDNDGNIYVTGRSKVYNNTQIWGITIKYNSSGVIIWEKQDLIDVNSSHMDEKNNLYIFGNKIIKYNSNGTKLYGVTFYAPDNSIGNAYNLNIDKNNNIFVTGTFTTTNPYREFTSKYDSLGVKLWTIKHDFFYTLYNSIENRKIKLDTLGSVYISGVNINSGGQNYGLLKLNSLGTQLWSVAYDGPSHLEDVPFSIFLDNHFNIYVTGRSYGANSYTDFATIKYSQQVSVKNISSEIPLNFYLFQNYPNPFNPSTKINFSLPIKSFVRLNIYNSLGKEVAKLIEESLIAGTYQKDFSAEALPSGIYFYKIKTEKFSETKKMILIK